MTTIKKTYVKPAMQVYELHHRPALLQASQLGGNNPLNWGTPGDDR